MQLLTWPEVHGALTHFPVAMLVAGILFDLGGHFLKKDELRKVGFWMLVVAVIGAVGALISGWMSAGAWFPTPMKPPILYQHRLAAFLTAGLALVLLLWRLAKKDSHTGPALYASLALGVILAASAGFVGYLGGKMALPDTYTQAAAANSSGESAKAGETTTLGSAPLRSSGAQTFPASLIASGQKSYMSDSLGCVSCHSMNGKGGRQGPDLTHEGTRQPDIDWQIAHLTNPQKIKPNSTMPPYQGTDPATLKAVAAFLVSQK